MKVLFTSIFIFMSACLSAQKIDSIYLHLYTDSLKKGTYNYINVDGKLANGRYIPLDSTEIVFKADNGKFHGNNLWVDPDFDKKKISIKITLRSDTTQSQTFDMYIKQAADPDLLSPSDLERNMQQSKKRRRR